MNNNVIQPQTEILDSLSVERIEQLLTNDQAFSDFFHQLPNIQSMNVIINQLKASNLETGRSIIEKERTIAILQSQISEVSDELQELRQKYDSLLTKQASLMKAYSYENINQQLSNAIVTAESESDEVLANFTDKKIDLNDFITQYLDKRKLYHLRTMKKENVQRQHYR